MVSIKYFLFSRLALIITIGSAWPSAEATAAGSNWPAWRGTSGAGVVVDAKPPLNWSDARNVRWKTNIPGAGFSTPIIWGDRIFLLSAVKTAEEGEAKPNLDPFVPRPPNAAKSKNAQKSIGKPVGIPPPSNVYEFTVIALDRRSGAVIWQRIARREVPHERHHPTHGYASASPSTDGERLYVPFGSRGYYCYDFSGKLLWEKDLGDMRTHGAFGEGSSPALADGRLFVKWDHEGQSFIVALDAKTGREIWRQLRDERTSWSTPLVVRSAGRQQVIVPATKATRSYDAVTGEMIWEASGLTGDVVPMPVTGHGMVYVMSGFRGYAIQAIKLTARGDVSDTEDIAWSARRSAPYVPSAVLSGNLLYMGKSNDAYLSCLDAKTGEPHYQDQALPGVKGIYASPLATNGYLYVVGREGTTLVIKDAPKFEIIATNELSDRFDASPVAVDKELFLRGHEFLYCIAEQ